MNLMSFHGWMGDVQDDVGMRSITQINYRCVNDSKALTSRRQFYFKPSKKRNMQRYISGLVSLKTRVCVVEGIGMDKGSTLN